MHCAQRRSSAPSRWPATRARRLSTRGLPGEHGGSCCGNDRRRATVALRRDLSLQHHVSPPDSIAVGDRNRAYGLLGPESSSYLGTSDHVARVIAENGLRLVLDEHRATVTPTLKSGKPAKTKVTYGGDVDVASKWLWRFVDAAKTAGELYGRALVVFAAQHYACQLVLPNSKRRSSILPRSHEDSARKAFERVTNSVLPASHKALQRAL